ncbi:ribulokinase [Conexibacter sp. CPCC 206217]|uniref:ribulokinase n=1 Tax=Conexibacter sp. CPCC 206217 TaxID=3064574 RepID=UPI002720A12B|nr:ribulokinase [Conexibacter sp. CPCC 206217]MDO8213167.1 ribulokinase [Conexibacter sp. CPCC 206217]
MNRSDASSAIGIDFGTESGRVLVLDLATGAELATETVRYRHGVIEDTLPSSGAQLELEWALQHPLDYLEVIEQGIPLALQSAGVSGDRVVGLGVDFTSCTVLPVTEDGTPLAVTDRWRDRPHAWPKLWKHHAAQPQADRLTEVAVQRGEAFLARYGQRISSEWYFPKLLQIYQEDRGVYEATAAFLEATDWIVWQLTGTLCRSRCAAGYKAFWNEREGLPSPDYFEAACAGFSSARARLDARFAALGTRAGLLRADLAARVGLPATVAVAVGNVDSFVSVPAVGVERPGTFVTVVGTSICSMAVGEEELPIPGITGVVEDGILPGLYGYEAGQPAVGDMLAWFVDRLLGSAGGGYGELEAAAAAPAPGAGGLVALDWWNGNRSVLADADLSGAIVGMTLSTTPAEIYRALLESIAYSTRCIVDNFTTHGLGLDRVVACGGIAEKSPLLMQLFADVTGRPVDVPASSQVPARGAALFGAVAAGHFADTASAVAALRPAVARSYAPDPAASAVYAQIYDVYRSLHDLLGREHVGLMHSLRRIRREATSPQGWTLTHA